MDTLRPPPWLGGATIIFWGWNSDLLLFALPLTVAFEAARYTDWRWELSDRDLTRIADLNMLLLLGVGVYAFLEHGAQGLFVLTQWLPMTLFLLVGVLLYCQKGSIAYGSLFLSLRRSRLAIARERVDLAYPYLLLCLVAAAMQPATGFFGGVLVLAVWALWPLRSRRYPLLLWMAALVLALGGAFVTQSGIRLGQTAMEGWIMDWIADRYNLRNPSEQHTMIGQIGELKLSERILMRARAPQKLVGNGLLLRQTSYDRYFEGKWRATETAFARMEQVPDTFDWPLEENFDAGPSIRISASLRRGRGILALPGATQRIEGLLAAQVERSGMGVIRVAEGPEYISYKARIAEGATRDPPPREDDFHLPAGEVEMLERLVAEHGLKAGSAAKTIARVERFLGQDFVYSLVLNPSRWPSRTALSWFLTESRRGHCEYFATATVLLLRAAGVPSRYASGYLATEYSPWEEAYLIRRRHAHAWALAYLDGKWVDVDTTPAIWIEAEAGNQSIWQPVSDFMSWGRDAWMRWRWREQEQEVSNDWLAWLLLPLVAALAWRLYRRDRVRRGNDPVRKAVHATCDSPFYRVMDRLAHAGYERAVGEPVAGWLNRVRPPRLQDLREMLVLHQRLRFDPAGLDSATLRELARQVERWLERFNDEARREQ